MDNASLILQTLDRHLDHPVRLILYGRAALQLGFEPPQVGAAHSKDVDCIIPIADVEPLTTDAGFWGAQALTHEELRPLSAWEPGRVAERTRISALQCPPQHPLRRFAVGEGR